MTSLSRYAARPLGALAGGVALWLSFPEHDLWWLAPLGVALLAGVSWRRGFRRGAGLGLLAGWACFVPVLSWSGIYVGRLPWFALATLQALYVALMSGLVGWGTRHLVPDGVDSTRWARAAALALVPLGWVAQELARSTTPWGGFPWARLAFGQANGPLLALARFGGAPGVTGVTAVLGVLLLVLGVAVLRRRVLSATAAGALLVVIPLVAPLTLGRAPEHVQFPGEYVGFVQGNVPAPGLDFNAERRAVLDNHVRGTRDLAATAARQQRGDALSLVAWPENSSDIDPLRNADAAEQIDAAVRAVGVPVLVGAVLAEPVGHQSNVSLLYRPGGGEPERYTKLHPVPFAEYVPHRAFFRLFSAAVDLAGNFVAGDRIGVFELPRRNPAHPGTYAVLPTICFEVAYDGLIQDSVAAAGSTPSVLLVQTNNATFGYSAESEQQFAISRLRAVEHARSVVHVSTVGVSGVIDAHGAVTDKTGLFTAEHGIGMVLPSSERTPSDRWGPWPERTATTTFVLLLVLAGRSARRRGARTG